MHDGKVSFKTQALVILNAVIGHSLKRTQISPSDLHIIIIS